MRPAAKPRRPRLITPSERARSPSCHSERSEESWLSSNPAEANETRRKTPKAVSPSSGAACLPKAGLLRSSLKVRFGNSDLGLTFSELGIFRP